MKTLLGSWLLVLTLALTGCGLQETERTTGAGVERAGGGEDADRPAAEEASGRPEVAAGQALEPAKQVTGPRGRLPISLRGLLAAKKLAAAKGGKGGKDGKGDTEAGKVGKKEQALGFDDEDDEGLDDEDPDGEDGDDEWVCFAEIYEDGTLASGCYSELTGEFVVSYLLGEAEEGVVEIVQEGEVVLEGFESGWSEFTETAVLEDGTEYVTWYLCGFDGGETECEAETEEGDYGEVYVLEEDDLLMEEETWTDDLTYLVSHGAVYFFDGGLEAWEWEDDLTTEVEPDYSSYLEEDADGSGWGVVEEADDDGEIVRWLYTYEADGTGFVMDEEGNVELFDDEDDEGDEEPEDVVL